MEKDLNSRELDCAILKAPVHVYRWKILKCHSVGEVLTQVCCVHSVTDVSGVFCKCEESDFVVKIVVHFIYKKEHCDV